MKNKKKYIKNKRDPQQDESHHFSTHVILHVLIGLFVLNRKSQDNIHFSFFFF